MEVTSSPSSDMAQYQQITLSSDIFVVVFIRKCTEIICHFIYFQALIFMLFSWNGVIITYLTLPALAMTTTYRFLNIYVRDLLTVLYDVFSWHTVRWTLIRFFDFCFVCLLFSFSEFFRFECVHFIKCFSFLSAWIAFNRLLFVWHLTCTPKCRHIVTYIQQNDWKCLIYFICILLLWRHKFCGTCVCESEFLWTYIWVCVMCIVYISHTMYANCIRLFLLSRSRDHITL